MSVHHLLPLTKDARHPGTGLLDELEQWRDADWTPTSESHVPERRAIDANRVAVERAKGALMRRYGLQTFQAFSLMVRWSRLTRTPIHTLARTLVQRVDEADPQSPRRHRLLIRWLEDQLRHGDPQPGPFQYGPTGDRTRSHQTPHPLHECGRGVRGHHSRR